MGIVLCCIQSFLDELFTIGDHGNIFFGDLAFKLWFTSWVGFRLLQNELCSSARPQKFSARFTGWFSLCLQKNKPYVINRNQFGSFANLNLIFAFTRYFPGRKINQSVVSFLAFSSDKLWQFISSLNRFIGSELETNKSQAVGFGLDLSFAILF